MTEAGNAPLVLERVLYDACPLCGCEAITDLAAYDCSSHPLYKPQLPREMRWCECYECKHVFTDGYFGPEALEALFSSTHDYQQPGHEPEKGRMVWASIVERVTALREGRLLAPGAGTVAAWAVGQSLGRWLDVGFGNGALLCDAQEWGYEPLGIDLRRTSVEKLAALGVPARCVALEALDEPGAFSVISLADVLEHMPFPNAHSSTRGSCSTWTGCCSSPCRTWIWSAGVSSTARGATLSGSRSSTIITSAAGASTRCSRRSGSVRCGTV
jgi:hypothetical protein